MIAVTALQFLQLAVLARYLEPTDFGVMATLMVVIGFSQAFMDMGISNAIIHKKNITHAQLSSLYWLNIVIGLIVFCIIFILSDIISNYYGDGSLSHYLKILSVIFLLSSIGSQYRVLCQRELKFNIMSIIEIVSSIAGFSTALTLAILDYGIYSLIYAYICQSAVTNVLYLIVGLSKLHVPSFYFNNKKIKSFYSFGFYQMGERSLNYISANIDKVLIGKYLGMQSVGYYNMAWQLIIFPLAKINPVINKVAFPIYSKIQHNNEQINRYYSLSIKCLIIIIVPLLMFVAINSENIVLVVFGSGWSNTANLISILSFVGILKAIANPGGALLLSFGRADVGFWWNLFWMSVMTISIYVALRFFNSDINTIAYTVLLLNGTVAFIWHYIVSRICGIKYFSLVVFFIKTIVISTFIIYLSGYLIDFMDIRLAIVEILSSALLCVLFYISILIFTEKSMIKIIFKGQ
ncbi:hypothetical protein B003_12570 [Vibrio breoganii 1C10]|nr:hypothetical protein B003_12570 [Vibrio breoganii 1C10]